PAANGGGSSEGRAGGGGDLRRRRETRGDTTPSRRHGCRGRAVSPPRRLLLLAAKGFRVHGRGPGGGGEPGRTVDRSHHRWCQRFALPTRGPRGFGRLHRPGSEERGAAQ